MNINILFTISSLDGGNAKILSDIAIDQSKKNKIYIHVFGEQHTSVLLDHLKQYPNIEIHFDKKNTPKLISLFIFLTKYRNHKIKKIISNDALSNLYCFFYRYIFNTKWFSCIHGLEGAFTVRWNILNKFIIPKSHKCIVVSNAVKEKVLVSNFSKKENIITIYNGIDIKNSIPKRSFNQKYNIGMIANFYSTRVKGHYIAIDTMKKLPEKFKLNIYGSGKYFNDIQNYINKNNLSSRVNLRGSVEVKKISNEILSMICLIAPSSTESFGLSIVESMSNSVPVIANKVGGIPEIIDHKKNGILISEINSDKLAREIEKLANNPKENINLGQAAYSKVKTKFNKSIMLSKYDKIISI